MATTKAVAATATVVTETNFTHAISERLDSTFQLNHTNMYGIEVCLLTLVCARTHTHTHTDTIKSFNLFHTEFTNLSFFFCLVSFFHPPQLTYTCS